MKGRPAFSYLELAVVAVVVAIIFVVAAPDQRRSGGEQAARFCRRFESDVSYARSLSIAVPQARAVIRVDGANNRYWLALVTDPDTPILHPLSKKPYVLQCGPNGNKGLDAVAITGIDFGGDELLGFDAMGSTDQEHPARIQVRSGSAQFEVSIAPVAAESSVERGEGEDLSQLPGSRLYGGS